MVSLELFQQGTSYRTGNCKFENNGRSKMNHFFEIISNYNESDAHV